MNKALWRIVSCWLVVGLALATQPAHLFAQGSPYEESIVQMMAAMDQMAKVLATVKDAASAEAGRPQLKLAAEQFVTVRKKAEQLKQPDQKEKDAITEKYKKKLTVAVQQFRAEVRRVQGLPSAVGVLSELDAVLKPTPKKD